MTMAVFLAGLLLKIAMTASIVVAASLVVERPPHTARGVRAPSRACTPLSPLAPE